MPAPTLYPILRYADAPAAIEWLGTALGFEKQLIVPGEDGSVDYAELSYAGAVLGTGTARDGLGFTVVGFTEDVDAHYQRARAAGVEIIEEPGESDFARIYVARDPDGHMWSFGTYLPESKTTDRLYASLRYRDGAAAVDWLTRAFGLEKVAVYDAPDGSVMHAEMRFGSGVVMFGRARDPRVTGNPWDAVEHGLYLHVEDVDAHHHRAVAAEVIRPLNDTDYGAREYALRDPEGNLWSFGTYRPDSAP